MALKYYNPLSPFLPDMIEGFRKQKRRYLVAQYYSRGTNPLHRELTPILLTPYENIGLATGHLGAIFADHYKCIIDLEKPGHLSKLHQMTRPNSRYSLFVALAKDKQALKIRNIPMIKEAIRRYISACTQWKVSRAEEVKAILELQFGELFLKLSYNGETITERLIVFEHHQLEQCVTTSPLQRILR